MTILTRNKVTNAGAELINSTIGGKNKISYTTAELYNKDISKLSDDQLAATTSIGTPIISGKCNVLNVTGTTVSIGSTIANGDLTADVTFCTVGWFATTSVDQANGKPPVLIAISQLDAPTTLAHGGDNGKATAYFLPKLNIGIANTTQIKLEPTESGFVTITELQQAMLALSNSGLIDLGNRLPNGMEVNKLHNTSLQYVPKGSVLGLPALEDKKVEDKDNDDSDRGGYLMSLGNNELTQDGVQIYFNPYYNKTFISFYNSKKNLWCNWIEVGSQSYTKNEIQKMLANYATNEALKQKADSSSVYSKKDIDEKITAITSNFDKYSTPDDIKAAKTQLIKYLQQAGLFSDTDNVPIYKEDTIYLDDETIKNGLVLLDKSVVVLNADVATNDDYHSFIINTDITYPLQIPSQKSVVRSLSLNFGFLLTIPVSKYQCYQILCGQFTYFKPQGSDIVFRTFTRNTPIKTATTYDKNNSVPMAQDVNITDLEEITDAILNKTIFNSSYLKGFYPSVNNQNLRLFSNTKIDLDSTAYINLGIERFDNCTLSVLSKPPYEIGLAEPTELLYSRKSLSGWLVCLPTGSDNENNSINFPLQMVICYNKKVWNEPELADNLEIYYRIFDTSKKNNTNYFRKLSTRNDTRKTELKREVFNFNNMINNTEGETDLNTVMTNGSSGYQKASNIGLPAIFDLINGSSNISSTSPMFITHFRPDKIPFSYKILNERSAQSNRNDVVVYQEIKCLGFIFSRYITISYDSNNSNGSKQINQWSLKRIYNPIPEEFNLSEEDDFSVSPYINAFVLPNGTDLDNVGATTYADKKIASSAMPYYPSGFYFLAASNTYINVPKTSIEIKDCYLVALNSAGIRLQIAIGRGKVLLRGGFELSNTSWKAILDSSGAAW